MSTSALTVRFAGFLILAVSALIIGFGFLLPKETDIVEFEHISVSPEELLTYTANFNRWNQWYANPEATLRVDGQIKSGDGATMAMETPAGKSWTRTLVGIFDNTATGVYHIKFDLLSSSGDRAHEFLFFTPGKDDPNQTEVAWTFRRKLGPAYFRIIEARRVKAIWSDVYPDKQSLQNLKKLAELPAFDSLLAEARTGDAIAQFKVGVRYHSGTGVNQDNDEALKWFRLSAEQGTPEAEYNLGIFYAGGISVAQDEEEAVKWYRKSAEKGYAPALFNLGHCYANGNGVSQDDGKALDYWHQSAEDGFPEAEYNLGVFAQSGRGMPVDHEKALEWFLKAARQGHTLAALEAGNSFSVGRGTDVREKEAFEWWSKAAAAGNAAAKHNQATYYLSGVAVTKSAEMALKLFEEAADEQFVESQFALAVYYSGSSDVGEFGTRDDAKAFQWAKAAATAGHSKAQDMLGDCFRDGVGIEANDKEATKWWLKSAEQGNVDAIVKLSESSLHGYGMPKDSENALRWALMADAAGVIIDAELLAEIKQSLTREQIDRVTGETRETMRTEE